MAKNAEINTFNVHVKTLELANYDKPADRSSAYQINKGEIKTRDQLLDYCDLVQPLRVAVYGISLSSFEDKAADDYSYEDIEEFLDRLDENEFKNLLKEIDDWISGDLDGTDFENTPRYYPFSGYDYAFYLFEGNSRNLSLYDHVEFDVCEVEDALNIYVVEGDHPGSSYLGAELGIPVDEANEIAQKNGYPIKFIKIS